MTLIKSTFKMGKKYHIIILLLQPVSISLTLGSKQNSNRVNLIGMVRLVFCIFSTYDGVPLP